jgi:hypothetical protein
LLLLLQQQQLTVVLSVELLVLLVLLLLAGYRRERVRQVRVPWISLINHANGTGTGTGTDTGTNHVCSVLGHKRGEVVAPHPCGRWRREPRVSVHVWMRRRGVGTVGTVQRRRRCQVGHVAGHYLLLVR